jgi:replicative DNA helicase
VTDTRPLPASLDAERSVLGAVLMDGTALFAVAGMLTPTHFFRHAHGRIYAAMQAIAERGAPIEFVTLKDELLKRGELDECGGPAFLSSLPDGMPKASNIQHYAEIVREKAALRALIDAANNIREAAYAASDDAREVMDDAERALITLAQDQAGSDLLFAHAIVPDTLGLIDQMAQTRRPVTGVSTGLTHLDRYTRGLHPGNLIVLGGRPGEGKSALALQLALHVAQESPVAFFSMEMNREEITTRALAQLARIDHHLMMQGRLSSDELGAVMRAGQRLQELPIAFDDTSALTPFQIRSKAKQMQSRHGLGFVVVDYLQLLQRPRHAHSREEAVAENTWSLKVLAGELKVPVLALSQLNRSSAKEGTRPTLTDLRESGAVEQHANVVLLIYRPQAKSDGVVTEQPPVQLLIAKQRNGPQGVDVELVFVGKSMLFTEQAWSRTA